MFLKRLRIDRAPKTVLVFDMFNKWIPVFLDAFVDYPDEATLLIAFYVNFFAMVIENFARAGKNFIFVMTFTFNSPHKTSNGN